MTVDEQDLFDYLKKITETLEIIKNTLIDIETTQIEISDSLESLESVVRDIDLS